MPISRSRWRINKEDNNMNRGLKINKQYLIFLLLFYFFILKDWLEQYWSFVGYGDEIIAAIAIPIFIIKLCRNQFLLKINRGGTENAL